MRRASIGAWRSARLEVGIRAWIVCFAVLTSLADLALIHGSVIHRSEKNLSQKSRFIYTVRL